MRKITSEKLKIAQCFSRAAKTYDEYSHVQQAVANRLLGFLPPSEKEQASPEFSSLPLWERQIFSSVAPKKSERGQKILDLGSGTGYCIPHLQAIFPAAQIIGVDLSWAQCHMAHNKAQGSKNPSNFLICADFDALPFASESFDIIFSSLTLQWSLDLSHSLKEIFRILKPQGLLIFSTVGSGSLAELQEAKKFSPLTSPLAQTNFSEFLPKEKTAEALIQNHFEIFLAQRFSEKFLYSSPFEIIKNIKAVGANYLKNSRTLTEPLELSPGLSSKKKFSLLSENYPQDPKTQRYPLTYQIDYFGARKNACYQ